MINKMLPTTERRAAFVALFFVSMVILLLALAFLLFGGISLAWPGFVIAGSLLAVVPLMGLMRPIFDRVGRWIEDGE